MDNDDDIVIMQDTQEDGTQYRYTNVHENVFGYFLKVSIFTLNAHTG